MKKASPYLSDVHVHDGSFASLRTVADVTSRSDGDEEEETDSEASGVHDVLLVCLTTGNLPNCTEQLPIHSLFIPFRILRALRCYHVTYFLLADYTHTMQLTIHLRSIHDLDILIL